MDQQSSQRWLETLNSEKRAKTKWESKYLTAEQQAREEAEQQEAFANLGAQKPTNPHLSERDAMAMRLAVFDDEDEQAMAKPRVQPEYEILRERVRAEVKAGRQRSHRYTGDLSTESMLKDIGPGLWVSINPAYAPIKVTCTSHRVHKYDKDRAADKVDKTHHLKQDVFMKHAEKTLELGEKVFVSGGMKLSKS